MSLQRVEFYSEALTRQVNVTVIMPFEKTDKKYPVLILLHGWMGNQDDWVRYTKLYEYAKKWGICIVMPSGENKFYIDNASTNDYFSKFISIELLDWVQHTYNVSRAVEDTLIGGLSMGGFGALINGLKHPERFGHIIALSPALIKKEIMQYHEVGNRILSEKQITTIFDIETVADYHNSINDYEYLLDIVCKQTQKPNLYLACGTEDWLLPYNQDFVSLLTEKKYPFVHTFDSGDHNWEYWDKHIKLALVWYFN